MKSSSSTRTTGTKGKQGTGGSLLSYCIDDSIKSFMSIQSLNTQTDCLTLSVGEMNWYPGHLI